MVLEYSYCPVPTSVKSLEIHSKSPAWFEDFVVPYGVRKLLTDYNLKEYPDSILDLEIKNFVTQSAPPFPKNLRYLTLNWTWGVFKLKALDLPPCRYNLSGRFGIKTLQEFNLKARKSSLDLAEEIHS